MSDYKLISLNVALFEKNNAKLSNFFHQQNPDIVCLQEVTKRVDEEAYTDFISLDAIDSGTIDLNYSFYAPTWVCKGFTQPNFHGKEKFTIDFNGCIEFGNYIRSKYPIHTGQNIFIQNSFSYVTDWTQWPHEDYRAIQVVDLDLSSTQKLRVINYHGIWTKDKQGNEKTKAACLKISELASQVTCPAIICGDFNLFPDTESMTILNNQFTSLVDEYNIKTTRPSTNELSTMKRNVVDYIFISNNIKVNTFEVIDTDISDHLPLLMDFSINN